VSGEDMIKSTSIRGLDDSFVPSSVGVDKAFFNRKGVEYETLYQTVKQSPEVLASFTAIIEDIMADEWKFIGKDKDKKAAEEFALLAKLYKLLTNGLLDLLTTGNMYILKLSVREDELKHLLANMTKSLAKELCVKNSIKIKAVIQELEKPKDLQLLKASTVKINYDETGQVASYLQEVMGNKRVYRAKDVTHISTLNLGGEVYGFTPLEGLLNDIATLLFAKNYAGKFFENDGTPDFLFKMPKDNPDSRNFKNLKSELTEMKKKGNKHRNLVVTGEVDVEQINRFTKDMEYSKLITHFTQLVLIGLGVPSYRINWTVGEKQQGSQVNRAYEGYYKKISFIQKIVELSLNAELFGPYFKVKLKFNRAYKIDEMREAQIVQILTQVGAITLEEARDLMGMEPKIPAGTRPVRTGDQNNINFGEEKKRDQGQDNNPKQPHAGNDNKLKEMFPEYYR
jgi:HK97 family phage portal protein